MRLSTTTLESYRLWRDGDWMDEAELLATFRGEFRPTPAVLAGQAFGMLLERPDRYRVRGGYRIPSRDSDQVYTVDDAVAAPALALMDHTHGVFEVKATKAYGDCNVVAVVDQIVGTHLYEHKTTAAFDIDKYLASCQWRFYLDIFGATAATYHVFVLDDHGNGVLAIRSIESFTVYPYPELHEDCAELVRDCRAYVKLRGLEDLLRARQAAA